jgi:hypothetical protein
MLFTLDFGIIRKRGDLMIDHLFIKNYKAFERENLPLDKNTLFIGTNNSGKSSILEALDLFFNHNLVESYIRDPHKDVVIEVHLNDQRYRKVFSPPAFYLNFKKCIGDMYDINNIKYLYIPKQIDDADLLNRLLTINLSQNLSGEELGRTMKVFDYLDGVLGNSNFPIFKIETKYLMNINKALHLNRDDYTTLISNINHQHCILGIDHYEEHFNIEKLHHITKYTYQTLFTTKSQDIVDDYNYTVYPLYKEDIVSEITTVKQMTNKHQKTYVLVEGKYDVAWFEKAIQLLNLSNSYRVIPCGGAGNIEYIEEQLIKEGIETIIVTDGDVHSKHSLSRDIIELYADPSFVNKRFNTHFDSLNISKREFFKAIDVKDDIVKKILSSWARKHLKKDDLFVSELQDILHKKRG